MKQNFITIVQKLSILDELLVNQIKKDKEGKLRE